MDTNTGFSNSKDNNIERITPKITEPQMNTRKRLRSTTSRTTKSAKRRKTIKPTKKVLTLLNKEETVRQSTFLKKICSDAGQCIVFGKENDRIKDYFDNFDLNSDSIDIANIKRIGGESANGFVTELPFVKDDYHAYTVLKSSRTSKADNLFYEAFVGVFINKMNKYYPCFLETYNSYTYSNENVYEKFKEGVPVTQEEMTTINKMTNGLEYNLFVDKEKLDYSCGKSKYVALEVQHLNNVTSLDSWFAKNKQDEYSFTVDLVNYLYQVYCPLSFMSDEFTHYDLHSDNVLIYYPSNDNNKYIKMVYHYPDGTVVEFRTKGIVKIIDYGRNYFNDKEENIDSKMFYNRLCNLNLKSCNYKTKNTNKDYSWKHSNEVTCGEMSGYSILGKEDEYGSFHYISSQKRNKSHDLRLANIIKYTSYKYASKDTDKEQNEFYIREILRQIVYENKYQLKEEGIDERFGTPEVPRDSYENLGIIRNVDDMHLALKKLIQEREYFKRKNDSLYGVKNGKDGKNLMGTLHVYMDRSKPIEYIPYQYLPNTRTKPKTAQLSSVSNL